MLEVSELKAQPGFSSEQLSHLAVDAKSDPAAFGRLYNQMVQPVYRYIRSRVSSPHEAEDLTSQTFIAVLEGLHAYRERGYFSAWLFRIARSKVMDHYRRSRVELPLEAVEDHVGLDDALNGVVRSDQLERLARLIRARSEDERELIRLRYVADLSYAEIAQVLGKREGAVKKTMYRLLASIKSQME